jgi:DNA invertase Pin-like site-specific DNA recombinase
VSGAAVERPSLADALSAAQGGDVLVVWKLDRLGRSLPHLIEVITGLRDGGIGFRSLQEQIDTTSAGGRFYFHMLAALAEFERELIGKRTKAGMASPGVAACILAGRASCHRTRLNVRGS